MMKVDEILQAPSMPLASPSYPRGPFRFMDREYMIVASDLTLPYGCVLHDYLRPR